MSTVTVNQINEYILELIKSKNISTSQQNQRINTIMFYYEKILGREKQYYSLHWPHKEQRLAKVLSKKQIKLIFDACENFKHRAISMLIYSAGLRRGELIDLKIADLDSDRMIINIRAAKGKKDRITLLSQNTLKLLRDYYKKHKPKLSIFEVAGGKKHFY